MKKILLLIVCLSICTILSSCAFLSEGSTYYEGARIAAKNHNYDSAFMNLKAFLRNDPKSKYSPTVCFALGEYYLDRSDYVDSAVTFFNYINDFPNDKGVIFAELIIYKIATQIRNDKEITLNEKDLIDAIRKKILSRPMLFMFFDNKKSFSYRSLFGNTYTAYDYVDKVKVMRNDKLFLELTP